jgi:hypothetical protein
MHRAVPAAAIRFGQGGDVASIRLDLPSHLAIHRRVIRVGDDHRVPRGLERLRDPLAFGAALHQNPHRPMARKRRHQLLGRRPNLLIPHDPPLSVHDTNLAVPRV